MTRSHTAGTAGDGYRDNPPDHPYKARSLDYGERPVCWCGRTRTEHGRAA